MKLKHFSPPFKLTLGLSLSVAAAFFLSCNSEKTTVEPVEKSCMDLGNELKASKGGSNPSYQVIAPNGGESFTVGQTLTVKVISSENTASASIHIMIENDAGLVQAVLWPNQTKSYNLQDSCTFSLTLPDSALGPVGGKNISLVSDKVKIRVGKYNFENLFNDFSDAYFTIKAK